MVGYLFGFWFTIVTVVFAREANRHESATSETPVLGRSFAAPDRGMMTNGRSRVESI